MWNLNLKKTFKTKILPVYGIWKKTHDCQYNYESSTDDMEAEGAKRVFECSINKRNIIRYVEYLEDGDTKSYTNVTDTYPSIKNKEIRMYWA